MLTTLEGWRKPASGVAGLAGCSLVVATYERPAEVRTLLRCVRELPDSPAEVVVVDGSLGNETERALVAWASTRDLPYHLTYVRSPAGLTRQRNVGIDASEGEIVFFLDDDCRPVPGYFQAIHQVFADDARGEVGAVCGSPINEMDKPLSLRWRLRLALGIAPAGRAGEYKSMGVSMPLALERAFTGARPVMVMPGCSMSFRRAVLDRHRFSQFFYGYSQGEDLEMSLRVGRDYTVLWCGDAHVIHDHAPSGRPTSAEKGRMEIRNRFFIWKRYARDAGLVDSFRFWSDTAYSLSYDFAIFVRRPLSAAPLRHMWGMLRGVLDCLVTPPKHDEPPARAEYSVDIRSLVEEAAAVDSGRESR